VPVSAWRITVTKGKQFIVEYRLPADQVPENNSVYMDILDSSGNPTGNPTELKRVGSTDIVRATVTAPSTVGKYEIEIWIGTWDGSNRTINEVVNYLGLEVVDKDIDDRVSDIETQLSSVQTQLNSINQNIETIMKWLKRHPA